MDADFVTRVGNRLHLLRKGFDGMAGNEPGRLYAEAVEQLQKPGRANLAGEHATRDVAGRIFAAVRSQPSSHRIDVNAIGNENFLCHAFLSSRHLPVATPNYKHSVRSRPRGWPMSRAIDAGNRGLYDPCRLARAS